MVDVLAVLYVVVSTLCFLIVALVLAVVASVEIVERMPTSNGRFNRFEEFLMWLGDASMSGADLSRRARYNDGGVVEPPDYVNARCVSVPVEADASAAEHRLSEVRAAAEELTSLTGGMVEWSDVCVAAAYYENLFHETEDDAEVAEQERARDTPTRSPYTEIGGVPVSTICRAEDVPVRTRYTIGREDNLRFEMHVHADETRCAVEQARTGDVHWSARYISERYRGIVDPTFVVPKPEPEPERDPHAIAERIERPRPATGREAEGWFDLMRMMDQGEDTDNVMREVIHRANQYRSWYYELRKETDLNAE